MTDSRIADMISKIAHELRSPLTSVKGFSSMLITRWDRFTDEQRRQFVETIHSDAERMGRIVSEVLDLARMEAGRLELHPLPVEVKELVDVAARRLIDLPGHDRLAISVPDGLIVWADPDRVESVLGNVFENALKFSDEGPVTVVADRSPEMVTITVRDSGVGIESEQLDGVFAGPSQRPTATATPSGSGLGLYLSKGLIEAHGGSISVDSKVGEWTEFTVTLPVPRDTP